MSKERITLQDTQLSAVMKLADGNPGAISAMTSMMVETTKIDPDAMMGGLGVLLSLDTEQIYGCRIWMLYNDVCGRNVVNTLALLRAVQLGLLRASTLHHAIDNRGDGINVAAILALVQEQLPRFAATPVETAIDDSTTASVPSV